MRQAQSVIIEIKIFNIFNFFLLSRIQSSQKFYWSSIMYDV